MSGENAQEAEQPGLVGQALAPIVAVAGTMVARRLLDFGYQRITGRSAPRAMDPGTRLRSAMLWAAVGAIVAAEIEVLVHRQLTKPRPPQITA